MAAKIYRTIHTGAVSTIINENLPNNVVVVSDNDGKVSSSEITSTELDALSGIRSNIQSQIDSSVVVTVDSELSDTSTNPLQNKVISEYIHSNGFGICSTARNVVDKVVTLDGFVLKTGSKIAVRFTNTTFSDATSGNITLNVNGTGAKTVVLGSHSKLIANYTYGGEFFLNKVKEFVYDGEYWVYTNTLSNDSLGQAYGTCSTAADTAAKVISLQSYTLSEGGIVAVKFTYAVPASATLNINNTGAKYISYKGSSITAGVINAGDTATLMYNGTLYVLLAVDKAASASSPTYSLSGSTLTITN